MDATNCVKLIQGMSDDMLRNHLYFMCGWRPHLMSEVCESIDTLRKEAGESWESSTSQGSESTTDSDQMTQAAKLHAQSQQI